MKKEAHTTIVQFLYITFRIGGENKLESTYTVSYNEIEQKVITQANEYHMVKAYTPWV